jgi:hypothetical protein
MTLGNDSVGYVRVRKRSLKGGHPSWRAYRVATGSLSTASMTFDLVRTVRVGGKSRHKFLLGLGSLKSGQDDSRLVWFWVHAIRRMIGHGLNARQRHHLVKEMVRKGARLPTAEQFTQFKDGSRGCFQEEVDEITRLVTER